MNTPNEKYLDRVNVIETQFRIAWTKDEKTFVDSDFYEVLLQIMDLRNEIEFQMNQ